MDQKERCQSCGMPLASGFYGTGPDSSENHEFCKFCFQNGSFTRPDMTLEKMIEMSVDNMTKEVGLPPEKAQELANSFITQLKRWKK